MQTREWTTINKSSWRDGPWKSEPDKMQWTDEATGYPCLIKRSPIGALCGYVGIEETHPAFGQGYDDVDTDVHGGLTFANRYQEGPIEDQPKLICHIPDAGEPHNIWWLGFDCAHTNDLTPRFLPDEEIFTVRGIYRDVSFVKNECQRLAKQLKAMETTS